MKGRTETTPAASSFRDPSGFIFTREGVLYRQVNASYREDYDALTGSGLYQALVERELLVPHEEIAVAAPQADIAYKVIKPERIEFVSYPYEWCFGQLHAAARTMLQIQKLAIDRGMSLKDASAYNIQFHRGKPILIDTLSFERLREGEPWVAYRQFCQHFLSPLALMAYRDVRLGQWARIDIDGVPLELASRLLPWRTRLSLPLLVHIHMHARAQRRYADTVVAERRGERRMGRQAMLGLVESLQSAVSRLSWSSEGTPWADYAHDHTYTTDAIQAKRTILAEWLGRLHPGMVWDLGANVGEFSRLASSQGFPTMAFDYDHGAVEQNYQRCVADRESHILPLVLDLTNPSQRLPLHFLLRDGRMVVVPVLKGTYERRDGLETTWPSETRRYRDYAVRWIQDVSRTLDYLESLTDMQEGKIAFLGISWGGRMGVVLAAVEDRFQAAVLYSGGLASGRALPSAA